MNRKTGLQLYSVRNELAKDFAGVISKIAAMGYEGVEFARLPAGISPALAGKIARQNDLRVSGAHLPLPIGENKNRVIDELLALGGKTLISGKGADNFKTADMAKKNCDDFNEAALVLQENGLRFAIHNHWWEFENIGATPAYKIMLPHLDPAVFFEIDTYWVKTAGADPVGILRELGTRAPLLHIKDGPCKLDEPMTAVGRGKMDFPPILAAAPDAEWLIVELDSCATDMLEAVKDSLIYLEKINRC